MEKENREKERKRERKRKRKRKRKKEREKKKEREHGRKGGKKYLPEPMELVYYQGNRECRSQHLNHSQMPNAT